jgi:DNA-directed RNA polymerase specialized sigma24 family protein
MTHSTLAEDPAPTDPATTSDATSAPDPDPTVRTPAQAFDALYTYAAPDLVRQAYLLTGRRALAHESVERAFHLAWQRWPEVAVDRDPVGWVRAALYEYATSPWHRLRRAHRHPTAPTAPGDDPENGGNGNSGDDGADRKALHEALLDLPPAYRRTLLLYDGLGFDLPETAAETEASTRAAAHRLLHARAAIAERLPELSDTGTLHARLDSLARAVTDPALSPAPVVRTGCERRARFWTRTTVAFTALIMGATGFTLATAPTRYDPVQAPGQRVGGVPLTSGPQRLSPGDLKLRDRLRALPTNGPYRLLPLAY